MIRMKLGTISLCAVAGVLMALISWERWDEAKNHGLGWGYWGEFNTVSNALAQVPDVTISRSWCNADFLALEEFGFDIISNGRPFSIGFEEKDPIRELSGQRLQLALRGLVKESMSNNRAQRTPR